MIGILLFLGCSGGGSGLLPVDDLTCEHGDVNQEFGFLGIDVDTSLDSVHQLRFQIKLSAGAPLMVSCVLDTDPEEVHQLSSEEALCHELDLYGLLADQDYTCDLSSLDVVETIRVRTAGPVEHIPEIEVAEHDVALSTVDYALVSHLEKTAEPNQLKLLIVDAHGRVRWSYFVDEGHSGDLDAQYLGDGRIFLGGATGLSPTIVKLSGRTEWVGPAPSLGGKAHHHVELLEDGDVLMLSTLTNTDDRGTFGGFSVEKTDLYAGTVRWVIDSQLTVDAGDLGRVNDSPDPWHANALVSVEDGDGVLVSLYGLQHILRLDPVTSQVVWRLGSGGDFELLDSAGQPLGDSSWFASVHAPELRGDRLLLYDNGTNARGSRVLELELDTVAWTAQELWSWTEAGWREPIWGDVDELGNGHLLITRGHCDECTAATPGSRSEVLELDPGSEEVLWRLVFPNADDGLYRSQRIDGCSVFANQKYCN